MDLLRLDIAADGAMRAHVRDGNGGVRIEGLPPDEQARAFAGRSVDFVARRLEHGDFEAEVARLGTLARAALQAVRQRDSVERGVPMAAQNEGSPSEMRFWQTLYEKSGDGWDLGRPAPPLESWFATHAPAGKRTLVLGCGRGHEARMLARAGARVTAVDFAPSAIAEARPLAEREGLAIEWLERDLFTLASDDELRRGFDLVVEHCCFCAIDPARRGEYVRVVAELVPSGGELVGLFYSHGRAGGPPFSVGEGELRDAFAAAFDLVELATPRDSIATRFADERIAIFRRR
jgi:SAM-dependent methyltransferase